MIRYIVVGVIAFLVGIGMGNATAMPEEAPAPTPRVVEVEVEVPGPTREVVREVEVPVEVEIVPEYCSTQYSLLMEDWEFLLQFAIDVLGDYVDYPEEDLAEFGRRVEGRIENLEVSDFSPDITACS